MIINRIFLKEKNNERLIDFDSNTNLIFSSKNSVGKTTLLRFLLYGLGFDIPNTRGIQFDNCQVRVWITLDSKETIELIRPDKNQIGLSQKGHLSTFVLPENKDALHRILFQTENVDLLNNILGVFYIDQEKGWTLLNRGKVIGNIHFSIEELIRGLANIDCSELIKHEKHLDIEKEKYITLLKLNQYKDGLQDNQQINFDENYSDKLQIELINLEIQQNNLKRELKRIDSSLAQNNEFKHFVSIMHLLVQLPNGEEVAITSDNIVGFNDLHELLINRRKIFSKRAKEIQKKIEEISEKQYLQQQNERFFKDLSEIEKINEYIRLIPFNKSMLEGKIKETKASLKNVKKAISERTKANNRFGNEISKYMLMYIKKLDEDDDNITENYIYTSNLKELSGAALQKRVFAFHLAYIKVVQEQLHITLPILMDSPRSRELDDVNTNLMMKILQEEFKDNQLIVASIYSYDAFGNNYNKIELQDRLIDQPCKDNEELF